MSTRQSRTTPTLGAADLHLRSIDGRLHDSGESLCPVLRVLCPGDTDPRGESVDLTRRQPPPPPMTSRQGFQEISSVSGLLRDPEGMDR